MVQQVTIENFKSIQSLTLELGRVNVFIGENGSGKSNILEAIAMGSAAAENKLDNEFLSSRGIRVAEAQAMRSGFEKENLDKDIQIIVKSIDSGKINFTLHNKNGPFSTWEERNMGEIIDTIKTSTLEEIQELDDELRERLEMKQGNLNIWVEKLVVDKFRQMLNIRFNLVDFLIYSPENYFLRRFEDESQITPLGIRGEGLFKLLSVIYEEKPEQFQKIRENLALIDWFEGFEIPNDLRFTERRIRIKDRFLEDGLAYFDQRSSNEGFLYLLFYFSLFISDYTPKFFAIDNIDNAMNPKLASRLVQQLSQLAKEHEKQVIMTTHNPAVLDGLDLKDDEQRLFVISRNKLGHTKALRITHKPVPEGQEPVRLSEQFLRGYIGGLPKNF
ncbi:AAA family ATPase [Runella sp.]|uniref:AAA family ATPase n=1 Tax=Runella sp. TaxID=1960881 RepID=UPI003D0D7245